MLQLNPDFRDKLFNTLLKISGLFNQENRDLLLRNFPPNCVSLINRSSAPMVDLHNITTAVEAWGQLNSGEWALVVLIQNALLFAKGTQQGRELEALLVELESPEASFPVQQPSSDSLITYSQQQRSKIKRAPSTQNFVQPPIAPLKGDYSQLRDLLDQQAWQKADQETVQIILKVAKRQKEGWLKGKDIENFSCSDLCMIDQLWVEASQGHFGFSVQRNIWLNIEGQPGKFDAETFRNFGEVVGWRINGDWFRDYTSFNFSLNAPKGHLPSLRFPHANGMYWLGAWQDDFKGFLTLMEYCLSRSY
ncbi:GUN4 domain-containing protein [Nostoc punctiforme FACHB-252]|uniref:GUN4 domain-containing protein n=1 Tax=Nostoc punctiforme FACHB-252 TaxID=1357509 RepID=A0ABR8HLB1_NOSPU|nr:GUN4 domain-containing protein [Nostoc punctiforme]MBD2616132.1 GUN4 domain-containing protein [Nostoc punctiforme FACHB-252]